jgi:hypothetical protein
MLFGLNEAALLVTVFGASFLLHPVFILCYRMFRHWFTATLVSMTLVVLLFTPSMLIAGYLDCRYRGLIFLVGLIGGSLLYELFARYRRKT